MAAGRGQNDEQEYTEPSGDQGHLKCSFHGAHPALGLVRRIPAEYDS
jgi:hypothetical protein